LTQQLCSSSGTWIDAQACTNVCLTANNTSMCGGVCRPGARQCMGLVPQTCDRSGSWSNGAPCPFGCGGAGVCNGAPADGG
jgi:hypothetical protein